MRRAVAGMGVWLMLLCTLGAQSRDRVLPIIDMHMHALPADELGVVPAAMCLPMLDWMPEFDSRTSWPDAFMATVAKPPCPDPHWAPRTDDEVRQRTLEMMERRNVIAVLSGPPDRVQQWYRSAPERFIPSAQLQFGRDAYSPEVLRDLFVEGRFRVLGEISNQYVGVAPNDQRMAPYWAFAEKHDIPVAIHLGEGPTGAAVLFPGYRAKLSSPFLLEEVLHNYPRLRISVMHYGSPLIDEMIAMLGAYPQLYVDIGGIQWFYPKPYFYDQLRRLVDAGFARRIMFGSDHVIWPGVLDAAIRIIEDAPMLSEGQKRDILYNNAARFLRLSDEEIARHHR